MTNFIKKVIRASAGTGKTYRLSLEYIGLLLKFKEHGIHFSEILVITFTNKATAEIRQRIFEQLEEIINQTKEGKVLCEHLKSILDVSVDQDDLIVLKSVYEEMLMNKSLVQISTIDAFTHKIFQTIIGPYLGLNNFEIENRLSEELLKELYQFVLQPKSLILLKKFFQRSDRRTIGNYENLIKSIIESRWVFHFIELQTKNRPYDNVPAEYADEVLANFREKFNNVVDQVQNYVSLKKSSLTARDIVKKEIFEIFFKNNRNIMVMDLGKVIEEKLQNESFIIENQKILFDKNPFWNANRLYKSNVDKEQGQLLKDELNFAFELLAEYVFYKELLPEEKEIQQLCQIILAKYDEIKFREKSFTYNDISYYTFKYLYDPELSLIDHNYVTNSFYEHLATRFRFILIDEFQDTSVIQFKILLPIIKEVISGYGLKDYGGTIAVGDEKQSIYGWRGGERDLLLQMPGILAECDEATLNTSFRSDEILMAFFNRLYSEPDLYEQLKEKQIDWFYNNVEAFHKNKSGYVQVNYRNFSNSKNDNNNINQEEGAIRELIEKELYPLFKQNKLSRQGTAILARKNKDLLQMANILDELGLNYILESSTSILFHRAVKPILYLFKYLAYKDIYDLLIFFRSDLVLINTIELKEIGLTYRDFDKKEFHQSAFFAKLKHIPAVNKLNSFIKNSFSSTSSIDKPYIYQNIDLLNFTRRFLEEYNVTGIFNLENEIKNINLFLEIISDFENSNLNYSKNLYGFLRWCEEIEQDEKYQQVGLESIDAIKLLSIHKAKGLEFENVFLYWNLTPRNASSSGRLNSYLKYETDYSNLSNYVLTYNYDNIMPFCKSRNLYQQKKIREAIEELNTFYVASTRAKSNLFLYFSFQKSGGIKKLFDNIQKDEHVTVIKLISRSIYQLYQNKNLVKTDTPNYILGRAGKLDRKKEAGETIEKKDYNFIKHFLEPDRAQYLKLDEDKIEKEKRIDYQRVFISEKTVQTGIVVHYYLSFIKFNTKQEREYAEAKTISNYGGLVSRNEIKSLINKIVIFISQNPDLFSPTKWDKVFTEHTIFTHQGQEFRVDRLMVNENEKEVKIIDYKTGEFYENKQVENYKKIIENIEFIKNGGYQVSGEFVEIDLSHIDQA
jgi:ATP-dependent exoDNAse (exonuclease V) beta subunit